MNAPLSKEQIALLMSDSLTVRTAVLPGTDGTVATPRLAPRPTLLSRLAAVFGAWRQHRAVLNELGTLSDRELADIGLVRGDLGRVFDPAFARQRDEALFRAANA